MNPHAHIRLRKAFEGRGSAWVEVSADDVLQACAALPPTEVTVRLTSAAQKALLGRLPPRRGAPVVRMINLSRQDLEHLLVGLDQPEPESQQPVSLRGDLPDNGDELSSPKGEKSQAQEEAPKMEKAEGKKRG